MVIQELRDSKLIVATRSVDSPSCLYRFDGFDSFNGTKSCLVEHVDLVSRLWHEILGHVNYKYLQQMSTQPFILGLPQISCIDGVCQGCALGKQRRDPFLHGQATCALAPLELIHSNLMSFPTHFFSAKYFLTFIDDFSKCIGVYFLRYKFDVFDSFQVFKTFVEKQSGLSIWWIHTDNGWE